MIKVRKVSNDTMNDLCDRAKRVHFIDGTDVADIVVSAHTVMIITIDNIAFAIDRNHLADIVTKLLK